jgi:hypothetical protein
MPPFWIWSCLGTADVWVCHSTNKRILEILETLGEECTSCINIPGDPLGSGRVLDTTDVCGGGNVLTVK